MKRQNILVIGSLVVLLGLGVTLWYTRKSSLVDSRVTDQVNQLPSPAAAKAQTPVAPPESVSAPAASSGPALKFSEMGVSQRDAFMQEIKKKDLVSIFEIWLDAGRVERDLMKQRAITTFLGNELRNRPPGTAFYEQLRQFIMSDSNSLFERGLLLLALGETETKESQDLLIQVATTSLNLGIQRGAINAIQSLDSLWSQSHEELSPPLERVWAESEDQYLLNAAAIAMARVGAPSGIKLLSAAALDASAQSEIRKKAALRALPEVLNPDAVPVLNNLLVNQPPTSETSRLASGILAEMNTAAAAKALVNWLQDVDATAAPLASNYVINLRSPAMLQAFQAALDPSVPFHSEQNREAIRAGLAQYKAGRKVGP
jgi:HEAT repeat protein